MKRLKSIGAFWYDFVVGDDWRGAAVGSTALAATALLVHVAGGNAWWLLPICVFAALGCRDVARVDFRMDADNKVYFLECNPLPGLTPGWSDLVMIANAGGLDYRGLIGEILSCAIRRYEERARERRREEKSAAAEALPTNGSTPKPAPPPRDTPVEAVLQKPSPPAGERAG